MFSRNNATAAAMRMVNGGIAESFVAGGLLVGFRSTEAGRLFETVPGAFSSRPCLAAFAGTRSTFGLFLFFARFHGVFTKSSAGSFERVRLPPSALALLLRNDLFSR